MTARERRSSYPPEWRGTWFRPGVPGGEPSPEAKRGAWATIIRAVDARVREEVAERTQGDAAAT